MAGKEPRARCLGQDVYGRLQDLILRLQGFYVGLVAPLAHDQLGQLLRKVDIGRLPQETILLDEGARLVRCSHIELRLPRAVVLDVCDPFLEPLVLTLATLPAVLESLLPKVKRAARVELMPDTMIVCSAEPRKT